MLFPKFIGKKRTESSKNICETYFQTMTERKLAVVYLRKNVIQVWNKHDLIAVYLTISSNAKTRTPGGNAKHKCNQTKF